MRDQARVVVIGGGAVGTSILYHLTEAGISDCLLVEKNELTSGSTWHAAGNIPTYANSWLGMRAGNYAWSLYRDIGEKLGTPITYRHTGAFWPAHNQSRMDSYHHLVGVSKSAGFDLSMITPDEMKTMHPWYNPGESVIGGIYDPYEGDIDPSQLTQALATGARRGGAKIARFTEVTALSRTANCEWLLTTSKGDIKAEIIINAAGFYGGHVAQLAGTHAPVVTLEHQYLVTESLKALEEDQSLFPLVRDPDIRFYLRRERSGLLLGSYGHPGRLAFEDGIPENFAHSLFPDSVDDIAEIMVAAIEHVPILAEAGVQRFVNGPIGYSPDGQPLCGPAYGVPNFYHACGIQVGITQSAAVGKALSEWITEGETEWDHSAWDPRRFGDWTTTAYARERVVHLYDLQYAIPYPNRLLESGRPVQKTPLYDTLKDKGAQFGQIGGWERAMWFDRGGQAYDEEGLSFRDDEPWRAAVRHECEMVRDGVGVMDHGGFTKFQISGPGAEDFLNHVLTATVPQKGRVRLSYMLTQKGMIWSEATVCCIAENQYLLCGPTLAIDRDHDWFSQACPDDGSVVIRKGTDRDAALMVMGPKSRELLSRLTDEDLGREAMPWMSAAEINIAGVDLLAMRISYVGELGWELHLETDDLLRVYTAIEEAGVDFGLVDFGSYALNAMRIEKGYHGWGADIGVEYTLNDAGLEGFAHMGKDDFIGYQTVLDGRNMPPRWRFVGFVVDSPDADPLPGDPICSDGRVVGYVTSGGEGFRIGRRLALGYVEGGLPETGCRFEIEILGRRCVAKLAHLPFYDPEHARPKS